MYLKRLSIENLRCFAQADVEFLYPGCPDAEPDNVTLLLGENGAGKTTTLQAAALCLLRNAMLSVSGFVPYFMVRRSRDGLPAREASITASTILHVDMGEPRDGKGGGGVTIKATRGRLIDGPLMAGGDAVAGLSPENSPAAFVLGYGSTRRMEMGEWDPGALRKRRTKRYQRVASLFEDHLALRPMDHWYGRLRRGKRRAEAEELLNRALPEGIELIPGTERDEVWFRFEGTKIPLSSLSDGYRGYISWLADLVGHLVDVCPRGRRLDEIRGVVLLDEIDLHLHPRWQRTVIEEITSAFPKLQFIVTTHSPIVAGTLTHRHIRVMERGEEGALRISRFEERIHGRGADRILESSYFGLDTTKAPTIERRRADLARRAAKGDRKAALEFVRLLDGSNGEP